MLADAINKATRRVPAWPIYVLGPLPALWWVWQGFTGGLGVEPIKALEHELGLFALKLLVAVLAVTPLRRFAGVALIKYRRALGVMCFVYVVLHLLVWLGLDVQIPALIWADIVKRPYITIGMAAFALLIPLAATSNNWSVRKLGRRWRSLHKLTYPAVLLGAVHFILLRKGFQLEPLVYLAIILALLGLRYLPARRKPGAARAA